MSLVHNDFGINAGNPWNEPDLYHPLVDWTDGAAYPALQPDSSLISSDYLRIAWEVLRRAPRYRMHFKRLSLSNLTLQDSFLNRQSYLSHLDAPRRYFPNWEKVEVWHHYSSPQAKNGQLLGEYVEEYEDVDWMIMHGHAWAMNFWGTKKLIDPKTPASDIDLSDFFSPSKPQIVNPWTNRSIDNHSSKLTIRGNEIPVQYSTVLTPRDIVLRLRTDLPVAKQMEVATSLLEGMQRNLGLKGMGSGARLTELGLASFWLRTWDFDNARSPQSNASNKELIHHLDLTLNSLNPEVKTFIAPGRTETFFDSVHSAITSRKIENWRERIKRYIVEEQDFYRTLLAKACL